MVVMEVLGTQGPRFPDGLSALGKEINCLGDCGDGETGDSKRFVSDALRQAIPLVLEAGQAEDRGENPLKHNLERV